MTSLRLTCSTCSVSLGSRLVNSAPATGSPLWTAASLGCLSSFWSCLLSAGLGAGTLGFWALMLGLGLGAGVGLGERFIRISTAATISTTTPTPASTMGSILLEPAFFLLE